MLWTCHTYTVVMDGSGSYIGLVTVIRTACSLLCPMNSLTAVSSSHFVTDVTSRVPPTCTSPLACWCSIIRASLSDLLYGKDAVYCGYVYYWVYGMLSIACYWTTFNLFTVGTVCTVRNSDVIVTRWFQYWLFENIRNKVYTNFQSWQHRLIGDHKMIDRNQDRIASAAMTTHDANHTHVETANETYCYVIWF